MMEKVGNRGVMGCCAGWLIGPLILGICIVVSGCQDTLHFDSIKVCTVILCLPRAIGQGRARYGLVLLGGLPKETCVRSWAETRASIALNLEGGTEGARDRVVTGLHVELP